MKKLIALILTLTLSIGLLTACLGGGKAKLNVGFMSGPTGMGMAKLIHDNGGVEGNDKYAFTKYADTTAAKTDLAAGKVDIVCLPTNEAAAYFNNTDDNLVVLAINCLNSLYLLTDKDNEVSSFADLSGKTVYTCKNGTPRLVLEYIVNQMNLDVTVSYTYDDKDILTPAELGTHIVAGNLPIVVAPEPIVTSSLLSIKKNGNSDISYSVDVDLTDAWAEISATPVTMGCIVAKRDFVAKNKKAINSFLEEYKTSVNFIGNSSNLESASEYIVETGIMAAAPAAKSALGNLGDAITYMGGSDMKDALEAFYTAIGMKLPTDEFYYAD